VGSQAAQFGAHVGCLLELVIDDARERQRPDDLLLVLQPFLEGRVNAQQLRGTDGSDVRRSDPIFTGKEVDKALLADQFARPAESDVLPFGANLDLAADDEPAAADTFASFADRLVWQEVLHRAKAGAMQGIPDRYRIRAELFKK
jgi:hypothetical protein